MATKASVSFSEPSPDIFSTILECCSRKAEIKYVDKMRHHIAGKSVFGMRKNRDGINFQIIFSNDVSVMDVYDYAKRGMDRRLVEGLYEVISPVMGDKVTLKLEDLNDCGVCKKKLGVGTPRFVPSIGWETLSELCESCYTLLSDHEKNYCCVCHKKLGFRKYSAKLSWNSNLHLCKECYILNNPQSHGESHRREEFGEKYILRGISDSNLSQKNIRKAMDRSVLVGSDDPLHILKIRLARGEINKTEYKEMRSLLEE